MMDDFYVDAAAITPSDTVNLTVPTAAIYVGGGGAVSVVMRAGGNTVVFSAVPVGFTLPISVTRVNATGTTATNLVALR
jgi:hypothetical protein